MLETIQHEIDKLSKCDKSFSSVFQEYVMRVQDSNIDNELSYMLSHNVVSIELIDRAILETYKEMINLG